MKWVGGRRRDKEIQRRALFLYWQRPGMHSQLSEFFFFSTVFFFFWAICLFSRPLKQGCVLPGQPPGSMARFLRWPRPHHRPIGGKKNSIAVLLVNGWSTRCTETLGKADHAKTGLLLNCSAILEPKWQLEPKWLEPKWLRQNRPWGLASQPCSQWLEHWLLCPCMLHIGPMLLNLVSSGFLGQIKCEYFHFSMLPCVPLKSAWRPGRELEDTREHQRITAQNVAINCWLGPAEWRGLVWDDATNKSQTQCGFGSLPYSTMDGTTCQTPISLCCQDSIGAILVINCWTLDLHNWLAGELWQYAVSQAWTSTGKMGWQTNHTSQINFSHCIAPFCQNARQSFVSHFVDL